jgi:hypothetical protein
MCGSKNDLNGFCTANCLKKERNNLIKQQPLPSSLVKPPLWTEQQTVYMTAQMMAIITDIGKKLGGLGTVPTAEEVRKIKPLARKIRRPPREENRMESDDEGEDALFRHFMAEYTTEFSTDCSRIVYSTNADYVPVPEPSEDSEHEAR